MKQIILPYELKLRWTKQKWDNPTKSQMENARTELSWLVYDTNESDALNV